MLLDAGNITANPTAGMQFLDFATGDSLQLTGHAEILFDERSLPGVFINLHEFKIISCDHAYSQPLCDHAVSQPLKFLLNCLTGFESYCAVFSQHL